MTQNHGHCWHAYQGPIWMVIPDGHVVQKCCQCPATRTIHQDHAREEKKQRVIREHHNLNRQYVDKNSTNEWSINQ